MVVETCVAVDLEETCKCAEYHFLCRCRKNLALRPESTKGLKPGSKDGKSAHISGQSSTFLSPRMAPLLPGWKKRQNEGIFSSNETNMMVLRQNAPSTSSAEQQQANN